MKILLINHYAGSPAMGMEFRPYYLAREWLKMGHSVTIVAASFSHLRLSNPQVSKVYTEEIIDGIRYIWLKTPAYKGNNIGRILNMVTFITLLFAFSRRITKSFKPDAVIASSTYPLDIYPASRIAKKNNAKLVFEVHDLWPMSPMLLGNFSAGHPFIKIMQKAEDYYCKNSDVVVSILPFANRHLETRGMTPNKFHHVPNGIAIEEWQSDSCALPEPHASAIKDLKKEGAFLVGYAGNLGLANSLDVFIESMKYLYNTPIRYVLIGEGPEKQRLLQQVDGLQLGKKVIFLPRIEKEHIPSLLAAFDALYIGLENTPLYNYGISMNKIFDYMGAGRPILVAGKTINNPVQEAECGISVTNTPKDIAGGSLQLLSLKKEDRQSMGLRGKKYVLKNHAYKILAKRFLHAVFGKVKR